MTATIGTLTTRVLIAHGDAKPIEVGTVTTEVHALSDGTGITLSTRRYRRDLATAFLRMAWHTWKTRA
ncbi:hypothetical protein [Microbacterium sp. PM5]|uniref:hypothetical protein n=1 Tax=Microbacterium sp. PM5 TaxID=2014534 RepID=UPI000DD0FB90|nr:hypothetical protein [Microbacterium sp. PM5]AXA95450.1 hypothetical protein CEP17_02900 [Microbacterium sp. PM5]